MEALICFGCEPKSKAAQDRRRACMRRKKHRPTGEPIEHHGREMRLCGDCSTLVVEV